MLTPEELQAISEGAEHIAEKLHMGIIRRFIKRLMARLSRKEKFIVTAIDKWQFEVLQEAGYLLEDIQKEVARFTRLQSEEIKKAFESAGIKAIRYDNSVYKAVGLPEISIDRSPYMQRLMQRNYEATLGEFQNFTRTTAQRTQQLFIEECDNAYHLVTSGAVSHTQAVEEAVKRIVSDGVYVNYADSSGNVYHRDTIETATLRCVRTGTAQAAAEISLSRMDELGWDTILVSAHLGARIGDGGQNPGNHFWWQGKFYSRSGSDKRFPPLSVTGYGTGEGLSGWNCRHSFGPGDGVHNPFEKFDSEENKKAYELSQRQRTLERRIRKTKREMVGLKAATESAKDVDIKAALETDYQKKAALLQRQNEAYNAFCAENNLKRLPDRIQIAEWDREQAKAAMAAAREYKKHE